MVAELKPKQSMIEASQVERSKMGLEAGPGTKKSRYLTL